MGGFGSHLCRGGAGGDRGSARAGAVGAAAGRDAPAFLEGLEVAFIALTFGSNQHNVALAAVAGLCAVAVVTVAGFAIRAPLARVPENTLKFIVGVMLTAFGVYWGSEGAGAVWPGSDAALLALVPLIALFALGLVAVLRRMTAGRSTATAQVGTEGF